MKKYFVNFSKSLNLNKQITPGNRDRNEFDNHIGIKTMYRKYVEIVQKNFKFELVSDNYVKRNNENYQKNYQSTVLFQLKRCVDPYLRHLTESIDYYFLRRTFPQEYNFPK